MTTYLFTVTTESLSCNIKFSSASLKSKDVFNEFIRTYMGGAGFYFDRYDLHAFYPSDINVFFPLESVKQITFKTAEPSLS